jgi:hypothetical protein
MAGFRAASQIVSITIAVVIAVPLFIGTLVGSFRARARLKEKLQAETPTSTSPPNQTSSRSLSEETRIMLALSITLGGIMVALAVVALIEVVRGESVAAWDRWTIFGLFWITAISVFATLLVRRGRTRKGVS